MTNVAEVIAYDPSVLQAVKEFVVMGGARSEGGNITASAEYNIFADPHAAALVFSTDRPVYAFGLDVTHQLRATPQRIAALRALTTRSAQTAAQLLDFASRLPAYDREQGSPVHDPCPIAWLIAPELFEFRECTIEVECHSPLTIGHTAVEFRPQNDKRQNVRWAVQADADGFFRLLETRLAATRPS
jgi:purine nucleosidase